MPSGATNTSVIVTDGAVRLTAALSLTGVVDCATSYHSISGNKPRQWGSASAVAGNPAACKFEPPWAYGANGTLYTITPSATVEWCSAIFGGRGTLLTSQTGSGANVDRIGPNLSVVTSPSVAYFVVCQAN